VNIKLGSLFDGIGTFPLSGTEYGIIPVWASEIEAFPIKVTKQHFPNMKHLGDVTKINGAEIEPVDIITFGSPCQDMSVAGKREGLGGARSGLFMDAVRIIREMRGASNGMYPRFAVWENVPGAYSSNGGQDFRAVLDEITEAEITMPASGKWAEAGMVRTATADIAWRTLDAQYWGVPQRRKRIFLVADFGGFSAGEILFKPESVSGDSAESGEARKEVARDAGDGTETTIYGFIGKNSAKTRSIGIGENLSPTIDTTGNVQVAICAGFQGKSGAEASICYGEEMAPSLVATREAMIVQSSRIGCTFEGVKTGFRMLAFGEYADDDSASTLKTRDYKDATDLVVEPQLYDMTHAEEVMRPVEPGIAPTLNSRMDTGGNQVPVMLAFNGRQDPISGEVTGALDTCHPQAQCIATRYAVRRLIPLECERLQGLPDNWTNIEGASDTARYKAIGNGIAKPCSDFVIGRIAEALRRYVDEPNLR